MQFNEKLKSYRLKKCISQAELAKQIFVSRSAVAKWENGLGLPSEESLKLLADYFEVPEEDLRSDPIHEDIVIEKNGMLSKQKILITVLSVLLIVATVLSAVFIALNAENQNEPTLIQGRGLMFSTENVYFGDFLRYNDNELSIDKQFFPSRVFFLSNDTSQVELPRLSLEVAKKADHSNTYYEEVEYNALTFFATEGVLVTIDIANCKIQVGMRNPSQIYFEGCVNIKYGREIMSIKVIKEPDPPIPVESVEIELANPSYLNKIGIRDIRYLSIRMAPYNATYQDFTYTIEKIERPDGSWYLDNLSEYAEIKDKGLKQYCLQTTDNIESGSKIYLYATATVDNVKSNTLIITVI